MKRIIDFFVAAYTLFLPQRYEEKRLEVGIFVSSLALTMNGISLFFFSLPYVCALPLIGEHIKLSSPKSYGVMIFIIFIVLGYFIKQLLEKTYMGRYDYIKTNFGKIHRIVMMAVVITHYLASIFICFYCMKFLLCLRP